MQKQCKNTHLLCEYWQVHFFKTMFLISIEWTKANIKSFSNIRILVFRNKTKHNSSTILDINAQSSISEIAYLGTQTGQNSALNENWMTFAIFATVFWEFLHFKWAFFGVFSSWSIWKKIITVIHRKDYTVLAENLLRLILTLQRRNTVQKLKGKSKNNGKMTGF